MPVVTAVITSDGEQASQDSGGIVIIAPACRGRLVTLAGGFG